MAPMAVNMYKTAVTEGWTGQIRAGQTRGRVATARLPKHCPEPKWHGPMARRQYSRRSRRYYFFARLARILLPNKLIRIPFNSFRPVFKRIRSKVPQCPQSSNMTSGWFSFFLVPPSGTDDCSPARQCWEGGSPQARIRAIRGDVALPAFPRAERHGRCIERHSFR